MLVEYSGFGELLWSSSVETFEKEGVDGVLKTALLTVGTGAVEAAGVIVKHLGFFVKVMKDRQRFKEVVSE